MNREKKEKNDDDLEEKKYVFPSQIALQLLPG